MAYRVCYITEKRHLGHKDAGANYELAIQEWRGLQDQNGLGYVETKVGKHTERITRAWVEKD